MTSLAKMQAIITKLEQKVLSLEDKYQKQKTRADLAELQLKQYKKNVEQQIEKAVTKAVKEVTDKYEAIIKEKDQRIFELETRLNINSNNSSLPSSQTPIYQSKICNSRKPTGEKPGRKLKHPKDSLPPFEEEEITEKVNHKASKCPKCNGTNLEILEIKTRDETDIKITLIKRRHYFYDCQCKNCGAKIKSEIPSELHGENQYGSEMKTLALILNNYGFVAYNRIRKIITGLSNDELSPSEGYLTKLQKKASSKLTDFVFDVKEKILKSKQNYWDDTVVKIGEKDKACMRVYTNEKEVLYKAHMAKDTDGMDEDGILNNLPEDCVVMHDHLLHNYCDDYKYQNIECNAHITRKLEGITQNAKHNWSDEMKKLLESTLEKRKQYISDKTKPNNFSQEEISEFDKKYDEILEKGFKEYIEFKHKYEFEKEENLLEFMRDYKGPITAWVRDFSLPYSNNLCETLLRMMKAKMKISYSFKSLVYAEYFANIRTYTETCSRYGVNPYNAIRKLFENKPYSLSELLKLNNNQ